MPMKTRFTRSRPTRTAWRSRIATTWPAISPAVKLRCRPSLAVRQNWQLTAQPTWLETQMVARFQLFPAPVIPDELGPVTRLSVVAFRHPDGFYGLHGGSGHAGTLNQIALGSIH